jgi:hypothetical protein
MCHASRLALLSVAPGAGALPTFLPIDVPSPRVGTVWGAVVAGIGVVNHDGVRDPPRSDGQARRSSPFTLVGQAAIAGASDAIPNGNLVYVCGSSGISIFDVTNVAAPQLLRTEVLRQTSARSGAIGWWRCAAAIPLSLRSTR